MSIDCYKGIWRCRRRRSSHVPSLKFSNKTMQYIRFCFLISKSVNKEVGAMNDSGGLDNWQMCQALSMHIVGEMTNTLLLSMFWIPTRGWFLFSHRDTTATFNISTCQPLPLHAQISRVGCQLSWPGPMSPPSCNWPCPLCRYVYRYKFIHINKNILKRQKATTLTNVIVLVGVSVLSANLASYAWVCPLFREQCVEKNPY